MLSYISIASILVSSLIFSSTATAQSPVTPADLRGIPKETPVAGAPDLSFAYLITKAVNGTDNKYSDLVIWGYHNGATLHAAVAADLGPDTNAKAWFNETGAHPQFDFGARVNDTHYFPFGMYLQQQDIYASWGSVQLDLGYGAGQEFKYDADTTGLTVVTPYFGGGWFVCDWYLEVPQLFWIRGDRNPKSPANCCRVSLFYECHDTATNSTSTTKDCYLHPPRPVGV